MSDAPTQQEFRNPFDVLAYIIMVFRLSLENGRDSNSPPRYARIARCQTSESFPKGAVKEVLVGVSGDDGLIPGFSKLVELTLQAKKALVSVDSLTALMEVNVQMVKEITSSSLITNLQQAIVLMMDGKDGGLITEFLPQSIVSKLEKLIKYIPQEEDLDRLSHELYRLSCVIYDYPNNLTPFINIEKTGKLRFLQWGFQSKWGVMKSDLMALGQLSKDFTVEKDASGEYAGYVTLPHDQKKYPLYKPMEKAAGTEKITAEINGLLTNLLYPQNNELAPRIMQFQFINELAVNGQLDNETLNRLQNLDVSGKSLKRALPFDAAVVFPPGPTYGTLNLVNGDADQFEDEGIKPITKNGYSYYIAGSGSKWKTETPLRDKPFFVAIQSRKYNVGRKDDAPFYEGGIYSEGEAADGKFFFAAALTHPWEPGNAKPDEDGLYKVDEKTPRPLISRMYQDVLIRTDLITKLSATTTAPTKLILKATCWRRSLYTQRAQVSKTEFIPDQGRILLEIRQKTAEPGKSEIIIADPDLGPEHTIVERGWMPNTAISNALMTGKNVNQKNNWFMQSSNELTLKKDMLLAGVDAYARVYLEGKLSAGSDIDAYFDDVRIHWSLE